MVLDVRIHDAGAHRPHVAAAVDDAVPEVGQALHVHQFLVVAAVVVHHRQQRDFVLGRGPQHAGRIHQVAIRLEAHRKAPEVAVGERRAYRGRCAVTDAVTAGAAEPVIMLFHRPQSRRPEKTGAVRPHQRPVKALDLREGFHHQARRANGAGIPAHGSGLQRARTCLGVGLALRFAALCDGRLAVIGDGRLYRFDQRRQRRLGIGGHGHVDFLEALHVLVVGLGVEIDRVDADEFGARLDARRIATYAVIVAVVGKGVHRGPEVGEFHADDDIGVIDRAGLGGKVVRLRKVHASGLVDDFRLQQLGQLHQQAYAGRRARRAIDHDHRVGRAGEQARRFFHRTRIALRRRGRCVARNGGHFAVEFLHRLLLQAGIEGNGHRAVGRRHGDFVSAHKGLRKMLQRHRCVVPLGVVAHLGVDVLGRMHRGHARRAVRGVELVATDHDHRHAVAPGVVDGHAGVLQADGAVAQRQQRLAGDLEVAVRHGHRRFLVHAGEELGHAVAAVIDQRLMDGAKTRGAVGGQVFDVERLDHIDHEVRARLALDAPQLLRDRRFERGDPARWRQRRGRARRRRVGGRRGGRGHDTGRAGGNDTAQKLPSACLSLRMLACHVVSPSEVVVALSAGVFWRASARWTLVFGLRSLARIPDRSTDAAIDFSPN